MSQSLAVTVLGHDRPGIIAEVTAVLTVAGLLPVTGEELVLETDAFEARALQHELDHLDGFIFLDRVAGAHAVFPRQTFL